MRSGRVHWRPLAGLLCSLAATAAVAGPGPLAAGCDDNLVVTEGRAVDRRALVTAIAAACGLRLLSHDGIAGEVRLPKPILPLAEAVDVVLADFSYQLLVTARSGPRRGTLWVFPAGEAMPPEVGVTFETVLVDGDLGQRRDAVRQLRRIADDDATRLLSLALADPDTRIREAAEEALAAIGSDEALAVLASAAANGDAAARAGAAEALSAVDDRAAFSYLAQSMADPNPRVRAATVHALGNLDVAESRRLLRQAFDDPDESVREAALDVLDELEDVALFHAVFPAD